MLSTETLLQRASRWNSSENAAGGDFVNTADFEPLRRILGAIEWAGEQVGTGDGEIESIGPVET